MIFTSKDILLLTSLKMWQCLVAISLDFFLQKQTHFDGHKLQITFVIFGLTEHAFKAVLGKK